MDNFASRVGVGVGVRGLILLSVSLQLSTLQSRFHLLYLILLGFSWFVFASPPLIAHSLSLLGVPWRPAYRSEMGFFFPSPFVFWQKATEVSSLLGKRRYVERLVLNTMQGTHTKDQTTHLWPFFLGSLL